MRISTYKPDLITICYTCTVKETPKWFNILYIWYDYYHLFVKSDHISTHEEDFGGINVDGSQEFEEKVIVRSSKSGFF